MGLLRGMARTAVIAGTATAVSNRVSRRQAGRWAAQEEAQQQYEPAPAPAPAPVPPQPVADNPGVDLAQLQQLGELRAAGVLTEDEFQAQKARILGS